jgi:hypothetical protein
MIEEAKKNLLKIKLISVIIVSFLKLKDMEYSMNSKNIIYHIGTIKSMSNLFYDILSFNVLSLLINSMQYYKRIKGVYKIIIDKIKNRNKDKNI